MRVILLVVGFCYQINLPISWIEKERPYIGFLLWSLEGNALLSLSVDPDVV